MKPVASPYFTTSLYDATEEINLPITPELEFICYFHLCGRLSPNAADDNQNGLPLRAAARNGSFAYLPLFRK
ncbi:MAG: hypothetical protein ACLUHA_16250 [Bacteroides stercoris]